MCKLRVEFPFCVMFTEPHAEIRSGRTFRRFFFFFYCSLFGVCRKFGFLLYPFEQNVAFNKCVSRSNWNVFQRKIIRFLFFFFLLVLLICIRRSSERETTKKYMNCWLYQPNELRIVDLVQKNFSISFDQKGIFSLFDKKKERKTNFKSRINEGKSIVKRIMMWYYYERYEHFWRNRLR